VILGLILRAGRFEIPRELLNKRPDLMFRHHGSLVAAASQHLPWPTVLSGIPHRCRRPFNRLPLDSGQTPAACWWLITLIQVRSRNGSTYMILKTSVNASGSHVRTARSWRLPTTLGG